VKYFDPLKVAPEALEKAGISSLLLLNVSKDPESRALECLNNVNTYIAKHGGDVQFGWIITIFGNIGLQLTAHAVVRKKDQTLVCVTLDNQRDGKVNFAPDDGIRSLIKNNFMPAKFISLIDCEILEKYIELMEKSNNLRVNSSCFLINQKQQLEVINHAASLLYPEILALAKEQTSQEDLCYCGSEAKRKNCCG